MSPTPAALPEIPRKVDPELYLPTTGRGAPGQEFRALETRPGSGKMGLMEWGAPAADTERQVGGGDCWGSRTEPAPLRTVGAEEVEDSRGHQRSRNGH